jgi:hypothetical protein
MLAQRPRGGDDALAGGRLAGRAGDRVVTEGGGFEFALDPQGERVAEPVEPGQGARLLWCAGLRESEFLGSGLSPRPSRQRQAVRRGCHTHVVTR